MAILPKLVDEILRDYKSPDDLLGDNGLLHQLTKAPSRGSVSIMSFAPTAHWEQDAVGALERVTLPDALLRRSDGNVRPKQGTPPASELQNGFGVGEAIRNSASKPGGKAVKGSAGPEFCL